MKELKDYLHLYIGCKISIAGRYNVTLTVDMTGTETIDLAACLANPEYKPILRPLIDMKPDEIVYIGEYLKMGFANAEIIKNHKYCWSLVHLNPNVFVYLLSKQFDLFGLIEAGVAIDATTIQHT